MSKKLFSSNLEQININQLEKELKGGYKNCIISFLGKQRIGKSTLINIILNYLKRTEKILYFKEEENMLSVTNGADYFVYSDDISKINYVFIDCEGSGNENNEMISKLYFLVASISDILVFSVDKAFEDKTFNDFVGKTISYLENTKIKIPKLYVLVKDSGITSLNNFVKENNLSNEDLIKKASELTHNKFEFRNHLDSNDIFFISKPPINNDEINTKDESSKFYLDIIQFINKLLSNITFISDISTSKRNIIMILKSNVSQFNQSEYSVFKKEKVREIFNKNKSLVFTNTSLNDYQTIKNQLDIKIKTLESKVKPEVMNFFLNFKDNELDKEIEILLENEKKNRNLDIENSYIAQKNEYRIKRENSKKSVQDYYMKDVMKTFYEDNFIHKGTLIAYCSKCKKTWDSVGCKNKGNHKGFYRSKKIRFLFIPIDVDEWYTCCGTYKSICPNGDKIHENKIYKYSQCKCREGTKGCTNVPNSFSRSTQEKEYFYTFQYTMNDWTDYLFCYKL